MRLLVFAACCLLVAVPAVANPPEAAKTNRRPPGPFELLDGDRVAFIGDTLIERAQAQDYVETALTIRWPDRHVVFRNLGWSGDDVTGIARSGFGTAEDGFKQLQQQVTDFEPTVLFVAYGANASFEGTQGLRGFAADYQRLLDVLSKTGAEIILLSPIRHENLGPPLPDPARFNDNRRAYTEAVRAIARDRQLRFVDLFHYLIPDASSRERLTDNGIHLNATGYWQLANVLPEQLGLPPLKWSVEMADGGAFEANLQDLKDGKPALVLKATELQLPMPGAPGRESTIGTLRVRGLPEGEYVFRIDGEIVASGSAREWSQGRPIRSGPMFAQVEELRRTIRAKNQLFFHRWRPQNETYLFGFRKHEQGQNAKEIPMFDPLIEAKEAEIARLRKPGTHTYELTRK